MLERAFEDLGVVYVSYRGAFAKGVRFEHDLGDFIRAFDARRYPELHAAR